MIRTIAPAKINWTLEVLGKRPDGYHEVRTVMQTIDLCDEITLETAGTLSLEVTGPHSAADDDHTLKAARQLSAATEAHLTAAIHVAKRIPVSAGLGGGSSDAAAVLRGLRVMHTLDASDDILSGVAAGIGSDTPFFLRGGTALASGRGELIEPLPDVPETWLVVVVPPISLVEKTRTMYAALEAADFTDGQRTAELAAKIRSGEGIDVSGLCNAFERAAGRTFQGLERHRTALRNASGTRAHLAGAGPALFSVHQSHAGADGTAGRLETGQGQVFVARTLGAAEAIRILA